MHSTRSVNGPSPPPAPCPLSGGLYRGDGAAGCRVISRATKSAAAAAAVMAGDVVSLARPPSLRRSLARPPSPAADCDPTTSAGDVRINPTARHPSARTRDGLPTRPDILARPVSAPRSSAASGASRGFPVLSDFSSVLCPWAGSFAVLCELSVTSPTLWGKTQHPCDLQ